MTGRQQLRALERGIDHEKPGAEKILRTTIRCLARKDCDRLSMREIAAAAGVSKSLLHYHFRSKDHLILELLERFFEAMTRRVAKKEAEMTRLAGEGPHALASAMDVIWKELRDAGEIRAIVLRVCARGTLDQAVRKKLVTFRKRIIATLVEGARHALGPNWSSTLPIEAVGNLLFCLFIGIEANRFFVTDPREIDQAVDLLKAVMLQIGAFAARRGEES